MAQILTRRLARHHKNLLLDAPLGHDEEADL